MRLKLVFGALPKISFSLTTCLLVVMGGIFFLVYPFAGGYCQTPTSPITSSGLNTQVSEPVNLSTGEVQHNITGGMRPGGGTNLFHSFGEFGVPESHIANIQNDSGMATSNILGRVTGGNTSNVFGTIQTEGFANANLFLMNPAGWVFGPNAALNVGGSVNFTTADYIRHSDGSLFMALSPEEDSQLSIAPIAAFGFLGSDPAGITVKGSNLTVDQGQTISLISGEISIQSFVDVPEGESPVSSTINAPSGEVRLASVASGGEVSQSTLDMQPNINGEVFTNMGVVTLSEGARLDASGEAAGTVRIRGGELVMTNAVITADTGNVDGAPVAIEVDVINKVSISTIDGPALAARATGTGNAGGIVISSGEMDVTAGALFELLFPIIDTHTSGAGNAGNVSITSGDLLVGGDIFAFDFFINSGTSGENTGRGGDITISGKNVQLNDTFISTGNTFSFFNREGGAGIAGNVAITSESLNLFSSQILTDSLTFDSLNGIAGDITITSPEISLTNFSGLNTNGGIQGGAITIDTQNLTAINSQITTLTNHLPGGAITITGDALKFTNGSSITSTTAGDGHAGSITITATDQLIFSGSTIGDRPSGIFSNSRGIVGTQGNSGDVLINTQTLELNDGSRINTSTATSGRGGNVTIHATDSIFMSGETGAFNQEPLFSLGSIQPSGIFTRTIGGNCAGTCGSAGNVSLTTGNLIMADGAQINSGTIDTGRGGSLLINTTGSISISGTLADGTPGGILSRTAGTVSGAGQGGDITLTSGGNFSLNETAMIAADSTGPGNSGKISIIANGTVQIKNGSILTSAAEAEGGDIVLTAGQDFELLNNSTILAESSGVGNSGAVTIEATSGNFRSDNSTVSTSAKEAKGGDIEITAQQNVELMNESTLRAESFGPGDSGTVRLVSIEGNFQSDDSTVSTSALEAQGGDIDIMSGGNVDLDDTTISAESSGPGNAGDISVEAGNDIEMTESTISTEAAEASGGNIKLSAPNIIQLTDSRIESSVVGGQATEGGNIDLDPEFIILTNSQILANATAGNGGNITLTATGAVFIDANSVLDASSETGISGNVTVNSPIVALAEVVAALPKNFVIPQSLFADACAAQAGGQFSSFTQGAPAALPPAPGGFLSSPLMLNNLSTPPSTGGTTQRSTLAQSRLGLDFSSISLLPAFGCGA